MEKIYFSVAICVYEKDNSSWFKTAVDSILNQTVIPDEIVLVVDGPVFGELYNIIKNYEKQEIFNVYRFSKNMGHGNARRKSLELCKYELVALMDADDICISDRFEKQLNIFRQHKNLSIVGGQIAEFIGDETNIVDYRIVPTTDSEIKEFLKKRCPFNQMTVMLKKSDVQSVGGYQDWYCNEDYYLWNRMFLGNFYFMNTEDVLVNVRVSNDMYNRRGGWKYFKSEAKLQKYMLNNKIINIREYVLNVAKRFVVQVLCTNFMRQFIYKIMLRKK